MTKHYYRTIYLKSIHWRTFRKTALQSHGRICKACGSMKRLDVHHLNYLRLWKERITDVEILCRKCHKKEHK